MVQAQNQTSLGMKDTFDNGVWEGDFSIMDGTCD